MQNPAAPTKLEVLITDISSYLGSSLAKNLLDHAVAVYGVGKHHLPPQLLAKKNFTLLDLDLTQPLPENLPRFDLIFHLVPSDYHSQSPSSPILRNLLHLCVQGQSKVVLVLPVNSNPDLVDFLLEREKDLNGFLSFYLVGDVYGPSMDLNQKGIFCTLVSQAVASDKIILTNEGHDILYPTYISDIVGLLSNVVLEPGVKRNDNLQIACSSDPQTALEIAYKIQKIAAMNLGRDLGLFFSGEPGSGTEQAALQLHTHRIINATHLEEGLTSTLRHFVSNIKNQPMPEAQSTSHIREAVYQEHIPHQGRHPSVILTRLLAGKNLIKKPKIHDTVGNVPKSKFKIAGIIIVVLLMLFIGKGIYDVVLGFTDLKAAKKSLEVSSWQQSQDKSHSAAGHFQSALGKISLITKPLSFLLPKQADSINNTFQSLIKTSQSLDAFSQGSQSLSSNIAQVASKKDSTSTDIENMSVNFKTAQDDSAQASVYAKEALIGSPFGKNSQKLLDAAQTINDTATTAYQVSNLLPYFTGTTDSKSYLLLMQNNTELRPGGGFIGNVGLIDFENGHLKNVSVEDVYNIDGQLKEKIEPPPQLKDKLGVQQFYLRDSNWSPDFSQNAQLARDFFKKETGKTVDGVISLDLNLTEEVLKATGPIKLPDYNETITADNLFDKGEYYSEIGFFPGSTQKKDFFGALSRALINRILTGFSSPTSPNNFSYLKLVQAINSSLVQKHLMVAVDDPVLGSFIQTQGFNHPLPPTSYNPANDTTQTRDYLAISEANLGANKVNRYIERSIAYDMTIGRDADLVARLTITYTNKSQAETWPGGKYVDFLRIYVPKSSALFAYKNGNDTDIKQVTGDNYGDLTVMSTYVEVPVKSSKSVVFSYRIPKNIKLETAPVYSLYVQKQSGTGADPFDFTFNLPNYLVATALNGKDLVPPSKNLNEETMLTMDKIFKIKVAEK
jgi:methyl-accepting chemotaxis protein